MQTIDLRKELKHLYTPSAKQAQVVDVPAFSVESRAHVALNHSPWFASQSRASHP